MKTPRGAQAADFLLDAVVLPSPYASSFGGFVELPTVLWWTAGGVGASLFDLCSGQARRRAARSLRRAIARRHEHHVAGGRRLIAGDSLAALSVGLYGLLKTVL